MSEGGREGRETNKIYGLLQQTNEASQQECDLYRVGKPANQNKTQLLFDLSVLSNGRLFLAVNPICQSSLPVLCSLFVLFVSTPVGHFGQFGGSTSFIFGSVKPTQWHNKTHCF